MSIGWKEFWNREHRIYVSDAHTRAHYAALAHDVAEHLPQKRPLTLLDWGCGEALLAPTLSETGVSVLLYDPVRRAYERAKARYEGRASITVLDDAEYESLTPGSVDVILIHSVLQYLSKPDFEAVLPKLRMLLASDGVLILGDLVPPDLSMWGDASDLLLAGMRHGFFFAAVGGLFSTLFSDYRGIRKANGFSMYSAPEMVTLLAKHGLLAQKEQRNLGLCYHRVLVTARKTERAEPVY